MYIMIVVNLVCRSHYSSMNSRILLHAVVMLASVYVIVSIPAATTADSSAGAARQIARLHPAFRAAAEDRHQLPA